MTRINFRVLLEHFLVIFIHCRTLTGYPQCTHTFFQVVFPNITERYKPQPRDIFQRVEQTPALLRPVPIIATLTSLPAAGSFQRGHSAER